MKRMENKTANPKGFSRRRFLQQAGVLSASVIVGNAMPARAAHRCVGPNERIACAVIGVGGMGRQHLNALLRNPQAIPVAVADPDRQRAQAARLYADQQGVALPVYADYRELLEHHPELDAVFIATPEHAHARAALDAMHAGKDVYCEKPLGLTMAEGRQMVNTARRRSRVVQMGTQQRSDAIFRSVCEWVREGRIGMVRKVVCYFGSVPCMARPADQTPPEYLNWDLYLGDSPWRAYNPMIHPYNFRHFKAFSGGVIADWGVHLFDIAQWAMNKDHTSPKRIVSCIDSQPEDGSDFPARAHIQYAYDDVIFEWRQGLGDEMEPGQSYGAKFFGDEGELAVNRGGYWARRYDGKPFDASPCRDDARLPVSSNHHDNFFACMRSRNKPICDVEIGHRATALAHLGNIAMAFNRPLNFDPVAEFFPDDPAANECLRRSAGIAV